MPIVQFILKGKTFLSFIYGKYKLRRKYKKKNVDWKDAYLTK